MFQFLCGGSAPPSSFGVQGFRIPFEFRVEGFRGQGVRSVGGVGGGGRGERDRSQDWLQPVLSVSSLGNQSGWPYPAFPKNPRTIGRRVAISRCSFQGSRQFVSSLNPKP